MYLLETVGQKKPEMIECEKSHQGIPTLLLSPVYIATFFPIQEIKLTWSSSFLAAGIVGRFESETERRRSVATVDWSAVSMDVPLGGCEM